MIRHTTAPTTLLHTAAHGGNRRHVGSFGALLSPNVPTGSVPVPPDAETLHAQPDETERLDLHRTIVAADPVPDHREPARTDGAVRVVRARRRQGRGGGRRQQAVQRDRPRNRREGRPFRKLGRDAVGTLVD